jgi:hypothetical protein
VAVERASGEGVGALFDAVVNERVQVERHVWKIKCCLVPMISRFWKKVESFDDVQGKERKERLWGGDCSLLLTCLYRVMDGLT